MALSNPDRIIAVCGLGRCGSTMTMRMLHAGGVEPFCSEEQTGKRFESPWPNRLPSDFDWLRECKGKAVKILRPDIYTPPKPMKYDFIYLMRNPFEQAKSQIKFIKGHFRVVNEPGEHDIAEIAERMMNKNAELLRMMKGYPDKRIHVMQFESTINDPLGEAEKLATFLGLDTAAAMAAVVERRSPECAPGILEGPNPVATGRPAQQVTVQ